MPDILIRGMEMPKNCFQCPLSVLKGERLFCEITKEEVLRAKIAPECPLHELPPHGDLIDTGKIRYTELYGGVEVTTANWIDSLPVIVPAEREGES